MAIAIPVRKGLIGVLLVVAFFTSNAQEVAPDRCGTMKLLEKRFAEHPALKARFESREKPFQQLVNQRIQQANSGAEKAAAFLTVPVVFHIVLADPSQVTDAQIKAQLDTLNEDYAGTNGDSVNIPSWFKPLFGRANIQFALALQTPDGEPTTGIERITTSHGAFDVTTTDVKHTSTGGVDAWNTTNYLNVWICQLSSGYLGLATFPDDGDSANQGAMIEYRSIPGGSYTNYNGGKTLSHEIGHYFNLYHVWGDDNGACTGTDYVADTPNQGDYTSGCPSGVKTDACSTTAPGILYQDYMDYSYDNCLVMFTVDQVARMQAAATTWRPGLFTSPGLTAPVLKNYDARLKAITQPAARLCTTSFTPVVTIHNSGSVTLTSLTITTTVDGVTAGTYNWTGSLATLADVSVTLNAVTASSGTHAVAFYTSNPNGQTDQNTSNDTLSSSYMYYAAAAPPLTESFEGSIFPPTGWDIVNPDASYTWIKASYAAKAGNSSAVIQNYYYGTYGAKDYLRLPLTNLSSGDSAFLTFQVAAATYTAQGTTGNTWDTLEVVVSTDCGNSYTSLYKKWGDTLVTAPSTTSYFVPTSSQWRKDSVNISPYIGMGNIMLAFRNTTENENNIYLDDINVYTKTVNPNLKASGFLVTPNPASTTVAVQFYPQPTNLRGIEIYSLAGQKLAEIIVSSGRASNYYSFDLSHYASGLYVVRAVFSDKVLTKKILKIN